MVHTLEAVRSNLHARFSPDATRVLTIDSGDTVVFRDIPDVSWGLEAPTSTTAPRRKVEPRDPVVDKGPCLCGPVAVRGAVPGDALEISIEEVRPASWGWTYAGRGMSTPALNAAIGVGDAELTLVLWEIDRQRGVATSRVGAAPLRPFLGTMGLAPSDRGSCPWTPRSTGGNMDCRELVAGSTLYLPVAAVGGLLSVGDGHAAQGDGELSGTAIECMMEEVRVRVTVRRDLQLASPRVRTPDGWVTMGFAPDLDGAAEAAASAMLDLMVERLGISRVEALALASSRVELRITQMVNPHRGVHAFLRA